MAIRRRTQTDIRKKAMLEALEKSLGIVAPACVAAGVGRSTFYEWMDEDPEFRKAVEGMQDIALDFAETKLMKRIKDESDTAIIFYLKTKGKRRGYIERQEIDATTTVTYQAIVELPPQDPRPE